jgi:mRNA interferase HigB
MQIVALRTLRLFWGRHPQSEAPLRVWYSRARAAAWSGPEDVKAEFGGTVDFIADSWVIFDIGGNKYRLIVHVSYTFERVLIKFIGTHKEYDAIDAEKIKR